MAIEMPKKNIASTSDAFTKLFREIEATGKTPQQIADDLGVWRTSLYRWLNGTRKIDKFTAKAIAAYHSLNVKKKK